MVETGNFTVEKAHSMLIDRKISCGELVGAYFKNIKKEEGGVHAYIETYMDDAAEKARAIDKKISGGGAIGELEGIPYAIKDNIVRVGKRATAASKILEPYVASYSAGVVERLDGEGAIALGSTNLDEFAMGGSCEYSAFGPTKNPRDLSKVPGGSSGGSAACVAADEAMFALGSDTGGSIRQPSSFCGVVGFKPTYGSVSRRGLIAMASSLDQIGVIAKSVGDAEKVFSMIAGKDVFDATSFDIPRDVSKKKEIIIGVPKEYFVEGLDEEVEKNIKDGISALEKSGVKIEDISLPNSRYALACYYIIMFAESSSNLARYDGVRYGKIEKADDLLQIYMETRGANFGEEVRRRVILGTYVLSHGYYEAYYGKAQKVRTLIKMDFDRAFKKVDFIVSPTVPTTAFRLGEKLNDPLSMYLSDIYTVSANLAGIPAISAPAGIAGGMPVGIQFMAGSGRDFSLLDFTKKFEALGKPN